MHAAHFGLVVVDQSHALVGIGRIDFHFFGQFAAHAFFIRRSAAVCFGVDGRDVSADAHAAFAVQTAFALACAPRILENFHNFIWVGVAKDHIWNQLLQTGILLYFAAVAITRMPG